MLIRLVDSALESTSRREFLQVSPLLGIAPAGRSGLVRPGPTEDGQGPVTPLDRLLNSTAAANGTDPALTSRPTPNCVASLNRLTSYHLTVQTD
eukprot:scaffold674957_cov59-Prasinocladus_malaysianus.AAC.2